MATESKLFWLALSSLLPVGILATLLWFNQEMSALNRVLVSALALGWIIVIAARIRYTFVHQMRTLNTLIEAIRAEDYSLRGTLANETGGLAELYQQINLLTDQL